MEQREEEGKAWTEAVGRVEENADDSSTAGGNPAESGAHGPAGPQGTHRAPTCLTLSWPLAAPQRANPQHSPRDFNASWEDGQETKT